MFPLPQQVPSFPRRRQRAGQGREAQARTGKNQRTTGCVSSTTSSQRRQIWSPGPLDPQLCCPQQYPQQRSTRPAPDLANRPADKGCVRGTAGDRQESRKNERGAKDWIRGRKMEPGGRGWIRGHSVREEGCMHTERNRRWPHASGGFPRKLRSLCQHSSSLPQPRCLPSCHPVNTVFTQQSE